MKISSDLEKTFKEISLNMRQWPTYKLKCVERDNNGEHRCSWDGMSKADQEYNEMFNELVGLIRKFSTRQMLAMLAAAYKIAK
jgi:hypothetical protein